MAINQILGDTNPMVHTEYSVTSNSNTITIPTQPNEIDFCYCDYECQYEELKIVNPGGASWQNDKSMFIDELVDSSGTIVYELYLNGVLKTTIIDNTYGTYYTVGSFPNIDDTDHSLKSGFICEWENVYNVYGLGKYEIKTTITNFTRDYTKPSQIFNVVLYTPIIADKTFRLTAMQNGYIQGGLDYTGLEWEFEYRIDGKLIEQTPEYIDTDYQDSERELKQIQAQSIRQYKLYCDFISSNISSMLIDDNIMANRLLVMDFNIWNHGLTYIEKQLKVVGIDSLEVFEMSQNANLVLDMKPTRQDKLKRNFK